MGIRRLLFLYTGTQWMRLSRWAAQASGSNCLFVWTAWDVLKAGSLCVLVSKDICITRKRVYQFDEEKTAEMCLEPKSNSNEEMTKMVRAADHTQFMKKKKALK